MKKNKTQGNAIDLSKIIKYLPPNFLKIIHEKIDYCVSERQIQYVIYENYTDKHGIKEIAIKLALKEKKRIEAISKKIAKLK